MIPKDEVKNTVYQVHYRPNDNDANAILRVALLIAGKDRCYLCKNRVTFTGAAIDHIIPRTIPSADLKPIKEKHLTPAQAEVFDLHRAHNLAPICIGCNSTKSNSTFEDVPALTLWLKVAHERQVAVEKTVTDLRSESGIKSAMSKLLASDLSSATVQECLAALGPSLIDRFRSEVPAVLEGPSAYAYKGENSDHGWDGHSFGDGPLVRPIVLDEHSRRAKIGLEEVFRWDFDEALDIAFDAVDRAIKVVLADQIVADSPGAEEGSSAEPGSVEGLTTITVNEVRIEEGTVFVRGSYESDGSAQIAIVDYQNDSGTIWDQGDTESQGVFEVPLSDEQGKPEAGDVILS